MNRIPDFTENEMWVVHTTLRERYGREVDVQLVDTDVRLRSSDRELSPCPAVYWEQNGCHFVVIKAGESKFRCQFYYRLHEQFGTGISEFDDLAECVVTLLQTQADYAAQTTDST